MSPHRPDAAAWLGLAAAPTFALMALATGWQEADARIICGAAPGGPLGGMGVMYLLMSGAHLGPWLRLLSEHR